MYRTFIQRIFAIQTITCKRNGIMFENIKDDSVFNNNFINVIMITIDSKNTRQKSRQMTKSGSVTFYA